MSVVYTDGTKSVPGQDSPISLKHFLEICQHNGVRVVLTYDAGRYIPGQYLFDELGYPTSEEFQQEHVVQGPSGWTIEVDMRSFTHEHKDVLYPTLAEALEAGLQLLRMSSWYKE